MGLSSPYKEVTLSPMCNLQKTQGEGMGLPTQEDHRTMTSDAILGITLGSGSTIISIMGISLQLRVVLNTTNQF